MGDFRYLSQVDFYQKEFDMDQLPLTMYILSDYSDIADMRALADLIGELKEDADRGCTITGFDASAYKDMDWKVKVAYVARFLSESTGRFRILKLDSSLSKVIK